MKKSERIQEIIDDNEFAPWIHTSFQIYEEFEKIWTMASVQSSIRYTGNDKDKATCLKALEIAKELESDKFRSKK